MDEESAYVQSRSETWQLYKPVNTEINESPNNRNKSGTNKIMNSQMLWIDCKDNNILQINSVCMVYSNAYFASGKVLYLKKLYEVYSQGSKKRNKKYFSLEIIRQKFVSVFGWFSSESSWTSSQTAKLK